MRAPCARRCHGALVVALAAAAGPASGQTTWYVDDDNCPGPGLGTQVDPFCSIQAGIEAAADGDEVEVAAGSYVESIDFGGKAITVRSTNPCDDATVVATVIDGTGSLHVVSFLSGEGPDSVLSGFVITGGQAEGLTFPDSFGGGVVIVDGAPTVSRCLIVGNTAGSGGGMFIDDGAAKVAYCTFRSNTADALGGGLYIANGAVGLEGCRFTLNSAGSGGAVFDWQSDSTFTDCTFELNSGSANGGGVYNDNNTTTLTGCSFRGNSTDGFGGAMYNSGPAGGGDPVIEACAFTANAAVLGGGGMFNGPFINPWMSDTVVCGNTPDQIDGVSVVDLGGNLVGEYCPPPAATCKADLNGDGVVTTADLLILLGAWGFCPDCGQ